MKPIYIESRDLPDAWFQCIYRIFENEDGVHEYVIDRGSFVGHKRREFDIAMYVLNIPGLNPSSPIYLRNLASRSQHPWSTLKNTCSI